MSDLPPARDPLEVIGEAYELLLEKTLEEFDRGRQHDRTPDLHQAIDQAAQSSDVQALAGEHAEPLAEALKKDLHAAARYLHDTGKELKDWFGFDVLLLEDRLADLFAKGADQTTVELLKLKQQAALAPYHTGEITGPGTLVCDACGEVLHFHRAGHVPPCPRCKGTVFHRRPG